MILFNLKKGAFAISFIFLTMGFGVAQTTDLATILQNANLQTQKYGEEFKNLLADEIKTFETYDKRGNVKKRTVIESNFIVLQSEKITNQSLTTEYRSVTKVDGKSVGDIEKRNADLFEQLAKAKSAKEELERIQEESWRYDKTLRVSGLTLFQSPVLDDSLRPFFEFSQVGLESYISVDKAGIVYVIIEYRQIKQSPNIQINEKNSETRGLILNLEVNLPDSFKKSDAFLRGKLWIDARTFQIWREEREVVARKDGNAIVLQRSEFAYQPSEYGILVPKLITLVENKVKKDSDKFIEIKNLSVQFQYSRWRKSNVDVQILDHEN